MADRFVAQRVPGRRTQTDYWVDIYTRARYPLSGTVEDMAKASVAQERLIMGMYEKEGGGLTRELSEAKVIGWRSQKKWRGRDGWSLIPVNIVPIPEKDLP